MKGDAIERQTVQQQPIINRDTGARLGGGLCMIEWSGASSITG